MKIYVTKFALTGGITEYEAEISSTYPSMTIVREDGEYGLPVFFHGKDWHTTKEAAIIRAEEMRVAKLKSLEKAIKKFSLMSFD